MAQEVIFTEQTLDGFALNAEFGLYGYDINPAPFTLVLGESYIVVWDGETFACEAQDMSAILEGCLALGNLASFGGAGNNEPFIIGWTQYGVTIFAADNESAHSMAIYQDAGESYAPNDAVILNYSKTPVHYENVPKVWLTHPESTEETPVLVPFTYGEAVSKTVEPDFSAGDMAVPIEDGELVTELTITKPEGLVPENIKKGETVAGVTGELLGDTEEVTVDLAMADGDQVIVPSVAGKSFSKVTITKPDSLVPENIAKDIEIGGIVGTHEGGGSIEADAYVEYTLDASGNITAAKLHGFKAVPGYMFYSNSTISSVDFTDCPELTTIGDYAFYNCRSLTSITIPSTVTTIGFNVITTSYTTKIYYTGTLEEWLSINVSSVITDTNTSLYINGSLVSGTITIPNTITEIRNHAFCYMKAITGIVLHDAVTSIGSNAFMGCGLTSVTIPDTVTTISMNAFRSCSSLTTLKIGGGITSMGNYAFGSCSKLTNVSLTNGITAIGNYCFQSCSTLASITIPASVLKIGNYAFSGCSKLTYAKFNDTSGWYTSTSSTATSGTNVKVTSTSTAATYLRSTYASSYWFNS